MEKLNKDKIKEDKLNGSRKLMRNGKGVIDSDS